ncbi:UDP-N-acetyl-D-mannosaminuronate dehydrogenase [Methanosarcina sp. MTP4]|nr:UDP-N-acetyl-D-mannosaminuronate dehydrogenase [Methanosarcina sp. MTP4]
MLGWAFINDSDDARNTPSEPYRDLCLQVGAEVAVHDPYVVNYPNVEISDDLKEVCGKENPVIVDGKNVVNPDEFIEKGFVYKGVGRGDKNEHMIKLFLIPKDTDLQIKNWKFTRKNVDEKMSNYYMV